MKYSNRRILTHKKTHRRQLHKDKILHILYLSLIGSTFLCLSLICSTFGHKKTGCITKIHPVFELSRARGKVVINVLLIDTGTVYVTLSFWFVVNANTFSFVTIVVSTRNTINTEVVKTNVL